MKAPGYWMSIDNCLAEAREIMQQHNLSRLPGESELSKLRKSSLSRAIVEYHNGFSHFRSLLGQESRRADGQLKDQQYVLAELKKAMKDHKLDRVPDHRWLTKNGYSSISMAIVKHHGGFHNVRSLMKEKQKMRERGTFVDEQLLVAEAKKIMKKLKVTELPEEHELRKAGYTWLTRAIYSHHGGMRAFRELLGEQQREAPKGSWKNLDYALEKAAELLKKEDLHSLPGDNVLREKGYSTLGAAIAKYHGGFSAFREKLATHQGTAPEKDQLEGLLNNYVGKRTAELENLLTNYIVNNAKRKL